MDDNEYAWYCGELRSYGFYKCFNCNSNWQSANSWVDFKQRCAKCHQNVYPFHLVRLVAILFEIYINVISKIEN